MKRLFKYLFLLLLLSSMTASEVRASWSFDETTGLLVVSTNYNYYNRDDYPWYSLQKEIKSVEISTGVTSIGSAAFYGCSSLTSIVIPKGVTSIGSAAFYACSSLTSIVIPEGVKTIREETFCRCFGLTSIEIPNSVTSIGDQAFLDCTGLRSIIIGNSVTSIGMSAFSGCNWVTRITIPESVKSIGSSAFYRCYALWYVYNYSSLDIVKGADTHGKVAYYAGEVLNFIKPLQLKLQKGEMYALSVPIVSEKVVTWSSSDASVATVDQNGNVTAVGAGTATITATAGNYSATCEVTAVTLTEGVYYMKNVGAGLFLTGGNAWGIYGTFSENGFDVTVTMLPSGKYVIDTKVDNWGDHYLGADGIIVAPQAEWTFEPQPGGTYAITNDGVNYIGYDGSTTVLNLHLTNPSEDNARWKFMTYEEVMAEICTATKDNPKTVTMLLPGAAFNQGDTRNGLWSDEPAVGGYQTEFASNKCGEKWNTPSFDVAQTLTNVPNGYYKVSMQGFYRMGGDENVYDASLAEAHHKDGTETLNAIFYANNEEKRLMSIIEGAQAEEFAYGGAFYTAYGNVPQDMDAAASAFTDGKYEHSLWVEVTDGTLRVGVKKDAESVRDWTIFDNFRVVYYGTQQPDAIEEATAVVTFQTNDVYDLSGRLVRRQAESLDGLKPGVYIVNGKKYMVK